MQERIAKQIEAIVTPKYVGVDAPWAPAKPVVEPVVEPEV